MTDYGRGRSSTRKVHLLDTRDKRLTMTTLCGITSKQAVSHARVGIVDCKHSSSC